MLISLLSAQPHHSPRGLGTWDPRRATLAVVAALLLPGCGWPTARVDGGTAQEIARGPASPGHGSDTAGIATAATPVRDPGINWDSADIHWLSVSKSFSSSSFNFKATVTFP
jgi:hypothetical protein